MIKRAIILYPSKIQLRTLAELQRTATWFKSHVWIRKGKTSADAKSFIEILALLDARGKNVEISAEGEDAREAVEALKNMIERLPTRLSALAH